MNGAKHEESITFKYKSIYLTINYIVIISALIGFSALWLFLVIKIHLLSLFGTTGGIYGFFIASSLPITSILVFLYYYLRSRPININENGISIIIFRRIWKSIYWRDISKIERFRTYDVSFYRYRHEFLISGDGVRIRFDDWMADLPGFLAILNEYVTKYQIPIFAVDRGRDTLRSARSTVNDRAALKKILRDGVRTPLSKL